MIPRTLVPVKIRPLDKDEAKKPPRRVNTYMDGRTVVPSELSDAPPLNGHSSIPSHLPLGVLVNRTLVPRGMAVRPLERPEHVSTLPLDILDSRIVVPTEIKPLTEEEIRKSQRPPELTEDLREVVEPDIFITGDANLLMEPEVKRKPKEDVLKLVLSIAFHVLVIVFLIASPKLFPPHVPTDQEIATAEKLLLYNPPELPKTPPAPVPRMHITPKELNRVAPPVVQPTPPPAETQPKAPDLPEQPKPQSSVVPPPTPPQPSQLQAVQPPPSKTPKLNLGLSRLSPGEQIQNQVQDAIRQGHQGQVYGGQALPGTGGASTGDQAQILSDTQGVDFTSYIQRLLATLRRNWEAVMPESVYLGDRGIVYTTFQINPDGSVPPPDPILERTSGKEPLDNAAMSAIHASNPFEPLPSAFHGPYLRLRIIFLYNIPRDQRNNLP
jgi:outer membrane biosynthesis protein TonB